MTLASTHQEEAGLWVSLSLVPGLGSQMLCQLLAAFGSPEQIYSASRQRLRDIVPDTVANAITAGPAEELQLMIAAWLQQAGNHLVTLADASYPQALLDIPNPPPLLYTKGDLKLLNMPSIAVVGSRHASPQGEKNAEEFSAALSQHGLCIVSGMALGIDGAAHRGALKVGGKTIAVVGTGLDIVYPARHRNLAHQIAEHGLIVSEFALGTPSRAQNFPRRNRIISGLSQGCLVIEANVQSGSLITARLAAEQGREVFAIPGSIHSPLAKGCHQLIKQGAKLVEGTQDILDEMKIAPRIDVPLSEHPSECHPLLDEMGYDPVGIDVLAARCSLTPEILSAMLLVLELEGKVTSLPGGRFQRVA
ncbi:DNA protecting protein DprA [Methylobacillus rhizosphaerae]|uniref:DNA protecting protein DprA n=1 Tax=Methylobacillus rhizosphaerae TaxID=551994 RepID=A0A238Z7T6_9PROT|nr:DNA-processing protein DprA [Methylobacillus rhizosphaerae]SNR79011.1 DNA protecting protein DprA [Methylobacillus rhizosphaerae]